MQLLTALFKKMKIKAQVLPNANGKAVSEKAAPSAVAAASKLAPRNKVERDLVEALTELQEIRAGRKQATSLKQFLDKLE